jgi:hypothetical protein
VQSRRGLGLLGNPYVNVVEFNREWEGKRYVFPRCCKERVTMSVAEIESAIARLPAEEYAELMVWIEKRHGGDWDRQIADDLAAGRLDALIGEAEEEYRQGLAKPL